MFSARAGGSYPSQMTTEQIINSCGHDEVNEDMLTVKWQPVQADGSRSTKGWLKFDDAIEVKSWYEINSKAPNIFRYNQEHNRKMIQSASGQKVSFWIASNNNIAYFSPQLIDILKSAGSDTIVIRPNGKNIKPFEYAYFKTVDQVTPSIETINIDYQSLYSKISKETIDSSGSPRIVLGYSLTTKAVNPLEKGDESVLHPSSATESVFAAFKINQKGISMNVPNLKPSEYVIDPLLGGTNPRRNCANLECSVFEDDIFWPNFGSPSAADKVASQALKFVNSGFGINGMATDGTFYDPTFNRDLVETFVKNNESNDRYICEYKAGIRAKQVQNSSSMFTMYNVLEPGTIDRLNEERAKNGLKTVSDSTWRRRSEELLQYSHGGLLEYFGGFQQDDKYPWKSACGKDSSPQTMCNKIDKPCVPVEFENEWCDPGSNFFKKKFTGVLDSIKEWRRNPEKLFMVSARGPKLYVSYAEDYEWQEYLYASYLLGSGANTSFKYISSFQLSGESSLRADGLQLYDNQFIDLGDPLPLFDENKKPILDATGKPIFRINKKDGLYWRAFQNVLVMVNPHDSGISADTISLKEFAPAGVNWSLVPKKLKPGQGWIATKVARRIGVGRYLDFTNPTIANYYAQNPTMTNDQNGFRVKETIPASLTDILLTPVKYKNHGGYLTLDLTVNKARSTTPMIAIQAEVDDERTTALCERRNRVIFEFYMGALPAGLPAQGEARSFWFRLEPKTDSLKLPAPGACVSSDTDEVVKVIRIANANKGVFNKPTSIAFGPNDFFASNGLGQLKFRRWDLMRFSGDFYIRSLKIGDGQYITSASGL